MHERTHTDMLLSTHIPCTVCVYLDTHDKLQSHPGRITASVHNAIMCVFERGDCVVIWSSCSPAHVAATRLKVQQGDRHKDRLRDAEREIKRKQWRKVRGENGLCTGWRWIITVFLSLPRRVMSPQPRKEQQQEATSCSVLPVMEGNLRPLSLGLCFYRSQHSPTFTISSPWIVNTKLYWSDTNRHTHTHKHMITHTHTGTQRQTSSLACSLPVLVIWCYQPSAAPAVLWFYKK